MRQVEQLGEHRHHRLRVGPDSLVAEPEDVARQRLDRPGERLRHAERVGLAEPVGGDADGLVGPAREALAQAHVGPRRPVRHDGDRAALRLAGLDGLLEGVLVVGRDDPLDVGFVDRLPVGADLDLRLGVRNVCDADDVIHPFFPLAVLMIRETGWCTGGKGITPRRTAARKMSRGSCTPGPSRELRRPPPSPPHRLRPAPASRPVHDP